MKTMAKKFVGQEYMAATNGKGLQQQSHGHQILARTTVTCSTIVSAVSVLIVVFCLLFQMCPVIGSSMMTTLNPIPNQNTNTAMTCIVGKPHHGDIVVMKLYLENSNYLDYVQAAGGDTAALAHLRTRRGNPYFTQQDAAEKLKDIKNTIYTESDSMGNFRYIVKRLIAVGGDRISMRYYNGEYYIYLNGEKLDESYLDNLVAAHNAPNFIQLWNILNENIGNNDLTDWVSTDCTSLLSDNNDTVADGYGVPSTKVLTVPTNYYFLMGDNRGSLDGVAGYSKSWDSTAFGPLPTANYYSVCVDILDKDTKMPNYLWQKFVYYVCFGWAWQK